MSALIRVAGRTPRWETDVVNAVFPLESDVPDAALSAERATPISAMSMVFVDTAALPLWERVNIPVDASDAGAAVYLDMLTRVLEDGLISTMEYSRLEAIAEVAHLGTERIGALHAEYLAAARAEALADGIVSDSERRELAQIATILDQPAPELAAAAPVVGVSRPGADDAVGVPALEPVHAPAPALVHALVHAPKLRVVGDRTALTTGEVFILALGARVVFTGAMTRPREEWARALAEAGFVTGSVTKNCAVLVAEDPFTQSGKAKTARAHGVPIVTEAEFIPAYEAFVAGNIAVG